MEQKEHLVITISREYASGGFQIGKRVAEKLGLPIYDRNSLDAIAHEQGWDKTYLPAWRPYVSVTEIWTPPNLAQRKFGIFPMKPGNAYYSNEREMFLIQSKIIYQLAEAGSCVFVGRCADFVLKHWKNCLRAFIYAYEDRRTLRMYDEQYIRTGDLRETLHFIDKCRAAYYRRNTGQTWGDFKNHHLTLDSGFLGADGCAEAIASAAMAKGDI